MDRRSKTPVSSLPIPLLLGHLVVLFVEPFGDRAPSLQPLFWPSCGTALALFLLSPPRVWPLTVFGLVAADGLVYYATGGGYPGIDVPRHVAALVAGAALRPLLGDRPDATRTRELVWLVTIGCVAAPLLAALVRSLLPGFHDGALEIEWSSDGLGVLIVVPLVLSLHSKSERQLSTSTILEMTLTLLVTGLAIPVFLDSTVQKSDSFTDFPYALLPLVLWCAYRSRLLILTLQLLLIATATVTLGPDQRGESSALSDQVFLWTLSLTALFLGVASKERKRAMDSTLRMHDALSRLEKQELPARVASGIAHDFKNDLLVISGWLEELEASADLSDGDSQEALRFMRAALGRSSDLAHRLLRLGDDTPLRRPGTLAVRDYLDASVRAWGSIVGGRHTLSLRDVPAVAVAAVPDELEHALINLILNARDAMPRGGDIVLEGDLRKIRKEDRVDYPELKPGTYARIRVIDSGVGITAENADRVFEPFFSTKRNSGGSGLGLSSVASFARKYGGTIRFESIPDRGTTFTLYLRVTPEYAKPTSSFGAERSKSPDESPPTSGPPGTRSRRPEGWGDFEPA
ncbi:MAG: MASE1 domain-containing protein [Planctomycetes bacterium]|nr:MASE1 domain-containing protein [Planctomycetota bacterium]